jgi:NAD(P)H-flavin reductase
MLYYAACTAPVLVESWRKYRFRRQNGLKITSLKEIRAANNTGCPSSDRLARSCVDLTFEVSQEAIEQYRCGQYVKLLVPEVSALSHPFTVNRVPSDPNRMRVLYRVVGPFTSALKNRLLPTSSTLEEHALPHIQMDAFYGTQDRLAQVLRHDRVVFVAGGIGITPYLSLLHEIHTLFLNAQGNTKFRTRKIVLHWICRDADLIKFISDEYFLPILHSGTSDQNPSCSIQIVIHKTGIEKNSIGNQKSYSDTLTHDAPLGTLDAEHGESWSDDSPNAVGMPLVPTRFSSYSKQSIPENIPYFGTVASISWVGLIVTWWMYTNFVHKHSIRERGYIVVAIVALSFIFAYIANVAMDATTTHGLCFGRSLCRRRRRQRGDGRYTVAWWSPLENVSKDSEQFDSDDNEEDSAGMSMTGLSLPRSLNESTFADEFQEDSPDQFLGEASIPHEKTTDLSEPNEEGVTMESTKYVTMVEKEGRPTAHSLLQSFEDTNNDSSSGGRCEHPGLFMCGPSVMMEEIKDASKTKCAMWLQQCSVGSAPHITFYSEAFEM